MATIKTYSADENMRRLKMQKKLKFVVVEGSDDVPIYESCLMAASNNQDFDVIFSGGKKAIRDFLASNKSHNAIFILDKDFDDISITDDRAIMLNRYSIENYFICKEVIAHSLKFAISCKFQDAIEAFDIDEFIEKTATAIEPLLKAIYYYQSHTTKEKPDEEKTPWSDTFICQNTSWELCPSAIHNLIQSLNLTQNELDTAATLLNEKIKTKEDLINFFPGKMLKTSLQRYIKQQTTIMKPGSKGKYANVEDMRTHLSSVLHHSTCLQETLKPAVEFLNENIH